jgi:predicted RNase H-like HicB family nuclease
LEKELVLLEKGKPALQWNIVKLASEIHNDKRDLFHVLYDFVQFCHSKERRDSSVSIVYEDVFRNMKMEHIKPISRESQLLGKPKTVHTISGYDVLFFEEDKGFTVVCPELPGCLTQGDTEEEAKHNAEEAISAYLECAAKLRVE